ncbi:MAG: hypothetical protein EOL98_08390 [Negativicutes bacterium]|nr:hypothetical protein [Negativicutes bacterium]
MNYSKFVNLILQQDERNVIRTVKREIVDISHSLIEFYNKYEPEDVEIITKDLSGIKLFPLDSLDDLQKEYSLGKEYFVFATKNGDPIALYNNKVVTRAHGSREAVFQVLAEDFDAYLIKLIDNMKV